METFVLDSISLLTSSIFYGLFFGLLAGFVRPLHTWFTHY